jgi:hypothetical protein
MTNLAAAGQRQQLERRTCWESRSVCNIIILIETISNIYMRRFGDGWLGRVRVGTSMTVLMYVLPPILRQLKTRPNGLWVIRLFVPNAEAI